MIFTSYYAKAKQLKGVKISISRSTPEGCADMKTGDVFGPDWDTLSRYKRDHNESAYTAAYFAKLHRLERAGKLAPLIAMLRKLETQSEDVFLLCYEKPSDFCHRHLLAQYLNQRGFSITEYKA